MRPSPSAPGASSLAVQAQSLASQCRLLGLCHPAVRVGIDAASFVSVVDTSAPFYTATLPFPEADPTRVVAQAREVSRASGRPQHVWAPAGSALARACWANGFRDAGPLAVMQHPGGRDAVLADHVLPEGVLPEDVLVVRSAEDAELFRAVHLSERRGQADAAGVVQHFASDAVLLHPLVRAVVRMDAGAPVAVGYLCAGVGAPTGLYWIQTSQHHRHRGHGAAVVQALLALAPPGQPVVLQATAMGHPVYQRAGFVDHGFVDRWVVEG